MRSHFTCTHTDARTRATTATRVPFQPTRRRAAHRALGVAGIATALLVPAHALAGETSSAGDDVATLDTAVAGDAAYVPAEVELKLRLVPPLVGGAYILDDHVGGVAIVGGSAALDIARWVTLEGGGAWSLVGLASAGVGFVRAGMAPVVLDTRTSDAQGWTLQPQALVGYEGLSVPRHSDFCLDLNLFDGGGPSAPCPTRSGALHVVTGTLGFDATYHVAEHFGVTLRPQLTVGGVAARSGNEWEDDEAPRVVTEPGMALGVAF